MADRRNPDDDLTLGPGAKTIRPQTAVGGQSSTIVPGQLLAHTYRIETLLARGGMGEVYRARHAELDTLHAIKVILPELAGNTRIVDLFRREGSILRTIRHDAIVAYDGVFRDENGRIYLVMEFVDGPSLSQLFKQGALPPAQVRMLRDRLADGLAAAHEKGVIHRDLSPDNVILPGGELTKAKIIDFGISKMADPEVKTIVGDDFAGKYSYVSPEQLGLYGGKVDPRSDIYSLGLVLAAAATGSPLDMGASPISVIEARRAVPKLDRVPAELRPELTAMLQPDPADRPQSLRDLVREKPRPVRKGDAASGQRAAVARDSRPSARGMRMAVVVGVLVLVLAAGGGVGYWLLAPTPSPPVPVPQPPQTDKIALLTAAANVAVQGFQCAELSSRVSQSGDIDVTGYVSSLSDGQQVTAHLQALPNVGRVSNHAAVMQPPLCEVLGILHNQTSSGPNAAGAPQIDSGGALGTYFTGQGLKLGVTATAPYEGGYLYVDYIDGQEGYVVHLYPNEFRPIKAIRAGDRMDIGSLPQEVHDYVVGPPYGTNLIVAISTPVPLFEQMRPRIERGAAATAYITALRSQLQRLSTSGYQNSLFGNASVLTFREQ